MSGQQQGQGGDREGVTITAGVEDHGRPLPHPETRHANPGDPGWRDEAGETDTPDETGSKVGQGLPDKA